MRPRFLLAACALTLLAFHTPSATAEGGAPPPPPAAPAYSGPTTNWHAELAAAIERAQADQLSRFYAEAARQDAEAQARAAQAPRARPSSSGGSHRGYATARECVSMTEHGGSYDESSNPSHKGRYQFSRSSWISFGGIPEHWDDWSLATPAEQDAVFEAAWSQGPAVQEQQWLRWDGCGPAVSS